MYMYSPDPHQFCTCTCIAQTPASFGGKSCFLVSYFPYPICTWYTKFEVASFSRWKKISKGSQISLDAPLAQTPINFAHKSCFLVSYSPNPSCIPHLKWLLSFFFLSIRGRQQKLPSAEASKWAQCTSPGQYRSLSSIRGRQLLNCLALRPPIGPNALPLIDQKPNDEGEGLYPP